MNTKYTWIIICALVVVGAIAWVYWPTAPSTAQPASSASQPRSLLTTVAYSCDQDKHITAAYYQGPEAPQPAPGEPPMPTGSVDVAIGDSATTTLAQTISADGTRYANADESLVFWSKGNTALVMRNNSMDLDYTNCAVPEASSTAS